MSDPSDTGRTGAAGVDGYVADLIAGPPATPGAFTLDREAARQALSRFQLADPVAYVGEVVQAAVAAGATRVDVRVDADETRITFDGRSLDLEDLGHLWAAALGDAADPASALRRQLALAAHGALGLDPAVLRIRSGDGATGARLEIRVGQTDEVGPDAPALAGTEVYVRRRLGAEVASRALHQLQTASPEEARLREVCVHCPIPVAVNGEVLPTLRLEPAPDQPEADLSVRIGDLDPPPGGEPIRFLQHGVVVATAAAPGPWAAGVVVTVASAALRRDLSLAGMVRDEVHARALAAADQAHRTLLAQAFQALTRNGPRAWTPAERYAIARALALWAVPLDEARRELWVFPMLRAGPEPFHVTLRELEARARQRGALRYLRGSSAGLSPAAVQRELDTLWCHDLALIQALAAQLGLPALDVREELSVPGSLAPGRVHWIRLGVLPALLLAVLAGVGYVIYRNLEEGFHDRYPGIEACRSEDGEASEKVAEKLEAQAGHLPLVGDQVRACRTRACNTGLWPSCVRLAEMWLRGESGDRDPAEAHRILQWVCDRRQADACVRVEEAYVRLSPEGRAAVVAEESRRCRSDGDTRACARAGLRRLLGLGVPEDAAAGGREVGIACSRGYVVACLAADLAQSPEYSDPSLGWWIGPALRSHCQRGQVRACERLGAVKVGSASEPAQAEDAGALLEQGCRAGELSACRWLARHHLMEKRKDDGLEILGRTCLRGDVRSCDELGPLLLAEDVEALGSPQLREALARACAGRGYRSCQVLSRVLREGLGGAPDRARAAALASQACLGGITDSCEPAKPSRP